MVAVELIYVTADKQVLQLHMEVELGTLIEEVIELSGIYTKYPETKNLPYGVFSKKKASGYAVQAGDRKEFYRPLTLDPMDKRRKKAKGLSS